MPVIRADPVCLFYGKTIFFGIFYTFRFYVDADNFYIYTLLFCPGINGKQVISAAATNLANGYFFSFARQCPEPIDRDIVPAQPGIDKVKFLHVSFDIRKWDIIPVEQFFLV